MTSDNIKKIVKKAVGMLIVFLLYILVTATAMIIASIIYDIKSGFPEMINSTMGSNVGNALQAALSIVMMIGIVAYAVKKGYTTRQALGVDEVSKRAAVKFILGFLAGTLFVCAEIVILCLIEKTRVTVFSQEAQAAAAVLCGTVTYANVALSKELIFRGYFQGLFLKRKVLGIVVTSLLFAAIHLVNSAYSSISLIYLIAGGFFFSILREVSGSLWSPIGFHMAWDWTEISIFGLNQENEKHWLTVQINDTVESLVCAAIMTVLCIILLIIYRKRQKDPLDRGRE